VISFELPIYLSFRLPTKFLPRGIQISTFSAVGPRQLYLITL